MKPSSGRIAVLQRAAFAEEIEVSQYGGFNSMVGAQGEWISSAIIADWVAQGLIEIHGEVGVITEKGKRLEYKDGRRGKASEENGDEQ